VFPWPTNIKSAFKVFAEMFGVVFKRPFISIQRLLMLALNTLNM
jgi:hypothetical protein